MRPGVRTAGIVAAVVACAAGSAWLLSSCSAIGGDRAVNNKFPPIDASSIVILGDSLSAQTNEEYASLLPGVTLDAFPGRTLVTKMVSDTGMDRIPTLKAGGPKWWVVALGTNDAAYAEHTAEVMAADVTAVLDAIGADQCVLWVLPAVGAPVQQSWIDNVAAFRDIVRFAMGSRSCGAVIDWQTVISAETDILDTDGIHLTRNGERRLAEFVLDGLQTAGALPRL